MSTTPSGTISLADVNTALGLSSTATISLNDSVVRFLGNISSGVISMNSLRNRNYSKGTVTVGSYAFKEGTYYGYGVAGSNYPSTFGSGTTSIQFYAGGQFQALASDTFETWTQYANNGSNTNFPGSPTTLRMRVAGGTQYTYTYISGTKWRTSAGVQIFGAGNVGGTYTWEGAY